MSILSGPDILPVLTPMDHYPADLTPILFNYKENHQWYKIQVPLQEIFNLLGYFFDNTTIRQLKQTARVIYNLIYKMAAWLAKGFFNPSAEADGKGVHVIRQLKQTVKGRIPNDCSLRCIAPEQILHISLVEAKCWNSIPGLPGIEPQETLK